jgi:hypothetical protein
MVVEDEGDRPRPKARKRPRRRGVPVWVWAAVILLVLAGGAVYYLGGLRPPAVADRPEPAAAAWTTYSPPGSPLTVELPGIPTAGEKQAIKVSDGRLERTDYTLTVAGDGGRPQTFEVSVFTHTGISAWAQAGKGSITEYVAYRDAGPGQADGVTVDGRPGFRYVRDRDGAREVRVYFGDGRAVTYKVSATGDGFGPDHPAVKRVLGSIRYR